MPLIAILESQSSWKPETQKISTSSKVLILMWATGLEPVIEHIPCIWTFFKTHDPLTNH